MSVPLIDVFESLASYSLRGVHVVRASILGRLGLLRRLCAQVEPELLEHLDPVLEVWICSFLDNEGLEVVGAARVRAVGRLPS